MRKSNWSRWTFASLAIGVAVGCGSVFQHITDEATKGTAASGTGFAFVESVFSDAPVSPGGTGGVVEEDTELEGETTRSFFKEFQLDPALEDSAGPKFVVASDVDLDGLTDLVSGWNQSQPVQLHLQRRDASGNISFRSITVAGTTPVGVMAGVQVGLINDDQFPDIVVLSKATGFATLCPGMTAEDDPSDLGPLDGEVIVYFNPGSAALIPDGDRWSQMILVNRFVQDPWIHDQFPGDETKEFEEMKTKPEWGGFTSLRVAEINGQPGDEIITALNPAECETLAQKPPLNTVDLWINPGAAIAEQADMWGATDPGDPTRRVPIALMADAPHVKDLAVMDVEGDGDLDVIATYTNAISLNVRWVRNPLIPHGPGQPSGSAAVASGFSDGWRLFADQWQERPIGQVDTAADILALGDVDGDGFDDILVRSLIGQIVQWFRRPNALSIQPEFPPSDPVPDRFNFPWPVFTLAEFQGREPEAIAVGDVTGDGRVEVMAAAAGSVYWFDGTASASVYDKWFSNTIVQDGSNDIDGDGVPDAADGCPTDPNKVEPGICGCGLADPDCSTPNLTANPTHINTLLVVDLDDDGKLDIVATLDRRTSAGLSTDKLVWYRNIRTDVIGPPDVRPTPRKPQNRVLPSQTPY